MLGECRLFRIVRNLCYTLTNIYYVRTWFPPRNSNKLNTRNMHLSCLSNRKSFSSIKTAAAVQTAVAARRATPTPTAAAAAAAAAVAPPGRSNSL